MASPGTRNRFAGQGDSIKDSGVQKWVNIFGDVQIIQNLERLRTSGQRNILRKAIKAGLKPIAALAKRKVHRRQGLLRKAIKFAVTKMVSGKVYVDPAVVGPDGEKPAKYAHLVEFGTRHAKAFPFMRPAMDECRTVALLEIQDAAKKALLEEEMKFV